MENTEGSQLKSNSSILKVNDIKLSKEQEILGIQARRTAFVARFIVLRESKRTRAHRYIETMEWNASTTADELAIRFRQAFIDNGDNMFPVDRDLRRALEHSKRSLNHFIKEYALRSNLNFIEALYDYEKSNKLLFGDDEAPKLGGWRLPNELKNSKNK